MIVFLFNEKSDVMNCGPHRGAKLLEHAMKIVEWVLKRQIRTPISLNKMQYKFMPGKKQWMQYLL